LVTEFLNVLSLQAHNAHSDIKTINLKQNNAGAFFMGHNFGVNRLDEGNSVHKHEAKIKQSSPKSKKKRSQSSFFFYID
jgi:hypothetical protein